MNKSTGNSVQTALAGAEAFGDALQAKSGKLSLAQIFQGTMVMVVGVSMMHGGVVTILGALGPN